MKRGENTKGKITIDIPNSSVPNTLKCLSLTRKLVFIPTEQGKQKIMKTNFQISIILFPTNPTEKMVDLYQPIALQGVNFGDMDIFCPSKPKQNTCPKKVDRKSIRIRDFHKILPSTRMITPVEKDETNLNGNLCAHRQFLPPGQFPPK